MRYRLLWLVIMVAAVAVGMGAAQAQVEQEPLPAKSAANESTIKDQVDVAVTVYNNNLALVRDRRKITLSRGEQALRFMDVAQYIRPETVSLRSTSKPGSLVILEQYYEYDLINQQKLMEKYVGRKVGLVNFSKDIGFTRVDADLLSYNDGPIYKVGDEIYLGHPGTVVLPEIPANLIAKPTLIWELDSTSTDNEIEATYLTGGISWQADYVVELAKDERSFDVIAWVTMNNNSGAQYTNAELKLVAGEVHQAPREMNEVMFDGGGYRAKAMAAQAPMREETFSEYHLYTLPRRTTIKNNQSKQVRLMSAEGVKSEKIYEYRGQPYFFSQQMPRLESERVGVFLKFANKKENELGVPLPGGVMRVYKEDSDGMLQFAGEDRIEHTPKDEDVRLQLGNAFDIVAERVQKDYRRISDRVHESSFEITLRNHKEENVVVDVVEPMSGDWRILSASLDAEKRDAQTAVFHVPVSKDGEAVLTYTVQVTY